MLFRPKEYSLNRVRDNITIKEGEETLDLFVDCDAATIIPKLINARRKVSEVRTDSTEEEQKEAAQALSCAMFGEDQTKKLIDFYHGDFGAVVTICGMYFSSKHGLGEKITKAQKKFK